MPSEVQKISGYPSDDNYDGDISRARQDPKVKSSIKKLYKNDAFT